MGYSTFVEKVDLSTEVHSYPQYMWITVDKLKNLHDKYYSLSKLSTNTTQ